MTVAHVLVVYLLGVGEGASPGPQMLEMQDYMGVSQNRVSLEDLGFRACIRRLFSRRPLHKKVGFRAYVWKLSHGEASSEMGYLVVEAFKWVKIIASKVWQFGRIMTL